jgi:hypothetical protein
MEYSLENGQKGKNMPEEVIPPGKIKCFITGRLRDGKPEEKVRQVMARSFVEEYGYEKKDMDVEFSVKMGIARKRADIVLIVVHTWATVVMLLEG